MKKIENLVLILASLAIIIVLLLFVFPYINWISIIDKNLQPIYNIMAFLSMLFSAMALLVAAIAYKQTSRKPKLELIILPWMAEKEGPALIKEKETGCVTLTRPLSSWQLYLVNNGKVSATNPIVKIRFKEAYFSHDKFLGWKASEHANAMGYYGFEWTPDKEDSQVVHPGFPYHLPTMHFEEEPIEDKLNIEVFIAADIIGTKNYEIPVKISYM